MSSIIYEFLENGEIKKRALYSIEPKKALTAYIRQYMFNDFMTWTYPDHIEGMRESTTKPGTWYFDNGRTIIGACPN